MDHTYVNKYIVIIALLFMPVSFTLDYLGIIEISGTTAILFYMSLVMIILIYQNYRMRSVIESLSKRQSRYDGDA